MAVLIVKYILDISLSSKKSAVSAGFDRNKKQK